MTNHQIPGIEIDFEEKDGVFTAKASLGTTKSRSVEFSCENGEGAASLAYFSFSIVIMLLI